MYNFSYATKNELKPFKREIIELIHLVQNELRNDFTFQYEFIGSEKRNIVTYDKKNNIGFDFDINLSINDDDENYNAGEIKHMLMNAFNKFSHEYKYDYCEDSTRVFTIKVKDRNHSRILHSCDFAVVNNYGDNQQEYIRFNKKQKSYTWEEQPKGFYALPEKEEFCKENSLWDIVRKKYLQNKNSNTDKNKKSKSIYADTIHNVCQQYGYYK